MRHRNLDAKEKETVRPLQNNNLPNQAASKKAAPDLDTLLEIEQVEKREGNKGGEDKERGKNETEMVKGEENFPNSE